jgi:two-component system, NarL family, nitrate/nitrite sensor histidine kinase NarX
MLAFDFAAPAVSPLAQYVADIVIFGLLIFVLMRLNAERAARLRSESAAAREAALAEHRRVLARDLHDSIAQHLGYLHLKLDELAEESSLVTTPALGKELEQLRNTANEVYEDIYCLISSLRSTPSGDLVDSLRARATLARQRADFETRVIQVGEPRKLKACYEQEIALVVREALANVEKHAHATLVDIAVSWGCDTLEITVRDNGDGFGTTDNGAQGHFGLGIMKERTAEMGGQLQVRSHPGWGTVVEVSLPLGNLVDSNAQPWA